MNFRTNVQILLNIAKKEGAKGLFNLALNLLDQFVEPQYMRSQPVFVQIEPTRRCNLKCEFCDRALEEDNNEDISLSGFKTIMKKLPHLHKISLVGVGEPLLNKELFNIIAAAKAEGIKIGFATNGTLLEEDVIKNIISSHVDWVNISIDGASKETFEQIRKGASFKKVTENTKRLAYAAKKNDKPKLSIWFLAVKQNMRELNDLVLLAKKLSVKKIMLQSAHNWAKDIWRGKIKSYGIMDNPDKLKYFIINAKVLASSNGIALDYVNIPDPSAKRACKWPWRSSYITADGFVTPCCLHGTNPKLLNFGNIFKEEFIDIWNNRSYRDFRRKLRSNSPPEICISCPGYNKKLRIS